MRTATGGRVTMWRAIFSARSISCACGTTSLTLRATGAQPAPEIEDAVADDCTLRAAARCREADELHDTSSLSITAHALAERHLA
jgi:hypothetical protein